MQLRNTLQEYLDATGEMPENGTVEEMRPGPETVAGLFVGFAPIMRSTMTIPSNDVLRGAAAIAEATGLSRRAVYSNAAKGRLPVWRLGVTLYGNRSVLEAWMRRQSDEAMQRAG